MNHYEEPAEALPKWLQKLVPLRRYRIDVGGVHMHVMERGEGFPVLMLHGNPSWGFLYRQVAERLAGEPLRIILPDLIGLGFSDKPTSLTEHSLERHATWLRALIDRLGISELIFVGQDWGGPIGLRAFADRRGLPSGLVLLNTVASPPRPGFRPTWFHRFARMPVVSSVAFRVLGFPQNRMHWVQGNKRSIRGKIARAYRYPLRHVHDRVAPLALARMVPDTLEHPSIPALAVCEEFVRNFRGPSALVWGVRDPILGRVHGHMQRLMPDARLTLTRAGHFLQEEVPDEIARAILDVHARIQKRS